MQNYSSVVAGVLASFPTNIVLAEEEEEGKAQLTRKAAWAITQENPNIGLMSKTSGNAVAGLTVDVIMDKSDGSGADIASSKPEAPGFVTITSVWSTYLPNIDPEWLSRWVKPTQELANLPGPMSDAEPEPPDPPEPPPGPQPPNPPPPPIPADWSTADRLSLQWYSEGGLTLNLIYLNLLWRPADPGGWGNWWFHIIEEAWTVAQVADAFRASDEYKAIHGA